jgi:hypothetical protein
MTDRIPVISHSKYDVIMTFLGHCTLNESTLVINEYLYSVVLINYH